jgi:glucokinase
MSVAQESGEMQRAAAQETGMGKQSVVAIDIGGTKTRVALLADPARSPDLTLLDTFPTEERYERQLDQLTRAMSVQNHGLSAKTTGVRIGVSVGARLARDGGVVAVAPNLRDYEGRPFVRDLAARCGVSVQLAHDPVCGLLAERRFGALRDADRCAYLTVSTGTGAAIYLGSAGEVGQTLSIEFGHQTLDGDRRQCLCGQVGCLETYTGGRQLALRYGRPLEEIDDATVWDALYDKLALGLVNLAQLTRVEVVALSGAIALGRSGSLDALRERVDARLRGMSLRLELAAMGEQAPLVGAALLLDTPERAILH